MSEKTLFEELKLLFGDADKTFDEKPDVWMKLVRDKLYSMLRSPLKQEYTSEAFKWISSLCISVGDLSWLCKDNQWTGEDVEIFTCIVRLSLNEIQITLPLIKRHLTYGDEIESEEGKVLARSANPEDYDSFGSHLIIIESAIRSLVADVDRDEDDDDDESDSERKSTLSDCMKPGQLKGLLGHLKDCVTEICDYLELVNRSWSELNKETAEAAKVSAFEGSLRLICVWLIEYPTSFEDQCKNFLIDLMLKNLDSKQIRNDLLISALHSICTNNDELMKKLRENKRHRIALQGYLDYVQIKLRDDNNEFSKGSQSRRKQKMFKLRCGLVRDLLKTV